MDFLKELKNRILIYDGSKGYLLQKMGLKGGECPELWNVTHREEVKKIYSEYKAAGADVIQTNTFQGNRIKLEEYSLGDRTYELNYEAARLAREVMGKDGFVAASIGPIGMLFEPSGELTFEKAYETFKEQVKALADGGVDIINFETFTDLAEMRAALLAAKETVNLPVICSISFEANGRTLMGSDPYTAAVVLKSLGADMIGANCSLGPEHITGIVEKLNEPGGIFLSVKPNAGLPEMVEGEVRYNTDAQTFAGLTKEFVNHGARLIGGCCGTTPDYIKAVRDILQNHKPSGMVKKYGQLISSGVKTLHIETVDALNNGAMDAGKDKELLENLRSGNMDSIVDLAIDISGEDYEAVYINVDKAEKGQHLLAEVVNTAQAYLKIPFILETESSEALDNALRLYKGKAGVIVERYPTYIMEELLRVAKKYGSTVVASNMLKNQ